MDRLLQTAGERMSSTFNAFALFANFENPFGDTARALRESVDTVVHAEELGFEQVWLTEHHFNAFSVSASIFALLAHLAAKTSRIQLGAGAVLLPFHDPVRVAEDAATVDALSGGRLLLGLGKGGPFPDQFRHFGVTHDESRSRLHEALDLLEKVFAGTGVSHQSTHYRYDGLSVYPRPIRSPLPVWLASMADESLALAAQRGYGLMGPSAAPVAKMRALLDAFDALQPKNSPPFVLARYLLCDQDHRCAREEALPFIRDFGKNMRAAIKRIPAEPPVQPFGEPAAAYEEDAMLANAIVGDPAACIEQCLALRQALGDRPVVLLLKPASYDPLVNRSSLSLFAERVRPALL
ncbi:LLM class flavin-dependent oxidoreductase [Rhodoferax sp.]|uniref:LLM class flavin-dependent oxidoreductase n=1 Tax=Rhodoferax sp. TaxID=50421 RepID=UPI00284E62E5|nr:LLM class flavin-dependent oxidoreductase [Rhodoferax sp.]MDR3368549.1 LLM class flavin-dependent oxidoreductase [Rhodoferax sp.]